MHTTAPRLRSDLEFLRGMDDIPLIFDPVTGRYYRISPSAEVLLKHLDGSLTTDELAVSLSGGSGRSAEFQGRLEAFVAGLAGSGLLTGAGTTPPVRRRRTGRERLMPRFVITRSLPNVLEPVAARLRSWPIGWLIWVVALGAIAGYCFGAVTVVQADVPVLGSGLAIFGTAAAIQLMLIFGHETTHALVAQYIGTPVRGLGVALLFYCMPVAYVDRTDAYRVRDRGSRVALALAGIVFDGLCCGSTALVAISSSGLVHRVAITLLGIQLAALAINLNPLLPSDGYSAVEAGTGLVDPRGRSMTMVTATLRRRPLPTYLTSLPRRTRVLHFVYGVFCIGYAGLIVVSVASAFLPLLSLLVGAVL